MWCFSPKIFPPQFLITKSSKIFMSDAETNRIVNELLFWRTVKLLHVKEGMEERQQLSSC